MAKICFIFEPTLSSEGPILWCTYRRRGVTTLFATSSRRAARMAATKLQQSSARRLKRCHRKPLQKQAVRYVNSLGDAAVRSVEVWRAELRAPRAAAYATPRITARGAVAGLHAVDAVAAHRVFCRGCASISGGRTSKERRLLSIVFCVTGGPLKDLARSRRQADKKAVHETASGPRPVIGLREGLRVYHIDRQNQHTQGGTEAVLARHALQLHGIPPRRRRRVLLLVAVLVSQTPPRLEIECRRRACFSGKRVEVQTNAPQKAQK